MAFDNRDSIDFGKERIPRLFKTIFIPTLMGMIADVVFVLTDGIFVGHGIGPEGLASINLVCPTMMLMTGLGVMFGMGSSIVAAIHMAKENLKAARINVTQAFAASIFLSLIVVVVFYSCPGSVLKMLGVSDNLTPLAKEYFLWFIPTCFMLTIQIVGSFVIRLDGSPRYSMMATVIPSATNILFDWLFIFPCGLGLKGAALATDIGTFVGMSMIFYYMFFRTKSLSFYRLKNTMTSLRLSLRNICYMIKVGFAGFIGEFAVSVIILAGNLSFGKYLGDTGIAAFSVICYILPVVINIYIAVSAASQPIISFNYGANQLARSRETFRFGVSISAVFAVAIMTIFWIFAPTIISIFLERGSETFELAAAGLPVFALGFLPMGFNISAIGFFQSTEKSLISILLTLMRGFIFIVAAFILLPRVIEGTTGLWLALPASELLTALFAAILLAANKRD